MTSMNKKLHIVFDTNAIKEHHPDYTVFSLNKTFTRTYDFILTNRIDFISLYIPQICIDELIRHYCEGYGRLITSARKKYDDFLVDAKNLGWTSKVIDPELQQDEFFKKIMESTASYFERYANTNIIPICSNERMPHIIKRALTRRDPFFSGQHKDKKFTDAGFKDVVFLESVIEYFNKSTDFILIITGDSIILNLRCVDEFPGKEVSIKNFDTGDKIVEFLCAECDIKDMSAHFRFCGTDYFYDTVRDALKCDVNKELISIDEVKIDEYICVDVKVIIQSGSDFKEIIVRLTEEHDFDEIRDVASGKVLHLWR